jgi:hypothetical protein
MVVWNSMLLELLSFPLDVVKQHVCFILPDLNLFKLPLSTKTAVKGLPNIR